MTSTKREVLHNARAALAHWNAIRDDRDITVHDTAGCAGMLAKALKDITALFEIRVQDEERAAAQEAHA